MKRPRSGFFIAGATITLAFLLAALFAPLLASHDPKALTGPSLTPPTTGHPLGTDNLGRDIFSQIVWGARWSLAVAFIPPAISIAISFVVGTGAGLLGGLTDRLAMRFVDAYLSIPALPLVVIIAAMVEPGLSTMVILLGLLLWPATARVLRSQTLILRERGFISAARGVGGGRLYVMRRHMIPALGPMLVAGFIQAASIAVPLEAGLAVLGLGDPGAVSWGTVLNRAIAHRGLYFSPVWTWWVLPAGIAVTMAVLGLTFLGVGLERKFNVRIKSGA